MKNTLTNNSSEARYFVVEPKATKVTEITSQLGEAWHCLKLAITPTHQVRLSIYRPIHTGGLHNYIQIGLETSYEQGLYIWDTLDSLTKKAGNLELPHQILGALYGLGDRKEEYYFWKPNASLEDWDSSEYTLVKT